jgi:hypothetical protein
MFSRSCRARALVHGVWISLLALTLLATSATARAQTTVEDPLLAQAEQLATRGDHAAALALLRVVVSRAPTPHALGLLGLSALRQGEPVDAEAAVQRALTTPSDAWVAAHRREINAALTEAARQLGTVIVEGVPDGTAVRIAGRDIGAAPLAPTRVRAGDVLIEAGAARVTVTVAVGAMVTATPSATGSTPLPTAVITAPIPPTTPAPAGDAASATATSTVPSVVFGGAAADARIPATFTAAFPATADHGPRERSAWTDGFRLNAGLGLMGGSLLGSFSLPSNDVAISAQGFLGFTVSGGVVLGVSRITELAGRLDVNLSPGMLDVRSYRDDGHGWPREVISSGVGSIVSPTLVFDFRLHPSATTPFYVAVGPRVGAIFFFARGESRTRLLFGAEIGIGSTIGADASWDLGLHLVAENYAFSSFITLDRRLF